MIVHLTSKLNPQLFLYNKGLETTSLLTFNNTPGVSIVLQTFNVTAIARGILEHAHLTTPLASKIRLALLVVSIGNHMRPSTIKD